MFSLRRVAVRHASQQARRWNSSSKPSLKLVAELRKFTDVSISKAREALVASNNDVQAAVQWLEQDLATSGVKKAAKVSGRVANEGLVSVSILSPGIGGPSNGTVRGAMVELNCETDFVGRNALFAQLAADIAHTAAFVSELSPSDALFQSVSLDLLNDAPLLSSSGSKGDASFTVSKSILDLISKVGEKVALRRAVTIVQDSPPKQLGLGLRIAGHAHGVSSYQGRVGALALLALKSPNLASILAQDAFRSDLERLERSLARQIVGFETQSVRASAGESSETSLYDQEFMMLGGESRPVGVVLQEWAKNHSLSAEDSDDGIAVVDFQRWTLGGHP